MVAVLAPPLLDGPARPYTGASVVLHLAVAALALRATVTALGTAR